MCLDLEKRVVTGHAHRYTQVSERRFPCVSTVYLYQSRPWAMTKAPVAIVAALRETSILFAIVISVFILKEKASIWRYVAGAVIAAGVLVMRLG